MWGWSANWAEQVHDIVWPFSRRPDGRWDLYDWNAAYFDRAAAIKAAMNRRGILLQFTLSERYGWSNETSKYPGVPDPNAGPFRHNVNGIRWGVPDDDTWWFSEPLPGGWLEHYVERIMGRLKGPGVIWRIGNEMKEKGFHERMRTLIRRFDPTAQIVVNREDIPGMYANMRIPHDYDRIEIHGLRDLATLDQVHDNGTATDRPSTFRELLTRRDVDCSRIVLSSDGCRKGMDPVDTYDWDALFQVAQYGAARGCSYSHQSRVKITRILTGRADLGMVEVEFLKRLGALYRA